jgi:filamentous hemagglutinin
MASYFPLIVNSVSDTIDELPSGDDLNLAGSNIANAVAVSAGNITTTGGTANLSNSSSVDLGAVGNLHISGGSSGQFLSTNGSGTLSWASGGSQSTIANGTSNVAIVTNGNVTTSVAGNANIMTVTGTGANVSGTFNATGNSTLGNLSVTGVVSSNLIPASNGTQSLGNATNLWSNLYLSGNTIYLGNATISANATTIVLTNPAGGQTVFAGNSGNSDVSGQLLSITGNANVGNIGSAGIITATGNIGGGNINTGGVVSATGNITGGNVIGTLLTGTVTTAAQPNITSVGTLTSLAVNGNISANNANITGNIVPTSNNVYSLGSASSYWKDAFIGPGSLYINGVKVLEESSNAIVISADLNQTVKVTSSGSGDIQLQTTGSGVIAVKGPLQIQAGNLITSSNGGPIGFSNPINVDTISSLSANTNLTISANGTGNIQINDDVTISGNLSINGGGGNLSVSSLSVEDNIIDVSAETTGTPVNNAGIRVIRGDEPSVQNRWNETSETWQITNDGSTYLNVVGSNTSTGNANVGNIGATGGIFTTVAGALTTGAQPNITSTGILASLSVSGNANVGNIGTVALVATGTGSFGANVNMNSNWITNVGYPSANTDVASKQYVDTVASSGISYHQPVDVATTTTLQTATSGTTSYNSPNGAANGIGAYISTTGTFLNIDGANVQTVGTRILVKNESNAAWNGIYTYANTTAIVRSTDADTYGVDLNGTDHLGLNDYFYTLGGVVNEGTSFIVSAPTGVITFGTSNIVFSTFSTSQVYDAGTGLSLTGTTFNVNASQTQVTAIGTLTSLSVSGNANVGNIGATNGVFTNVSGDGSALTSITGANVTGQVSFAATANAVAGGNVSGQVTYAATANAVAGANVSGAVSFATTANAVAGANVSGAVSFATTANAVAGANVSGAVNLANYASTANAVALANVAGIGNIASINLDGSSSNILYGNGSFAAAAVAYGNANVATFLGSYGSNTITTTGNVSVGNIIGNGQALTGLAGANVTGTVSSATTAGTVTTAAQPNITSTGTLTSVSVSGNATAGNLITGGVVSATGNISGNFFIGNGSQLTGISSSSATISNGTSNVNIASSGGNVTVGVGGSAGILTISTSGATVSGTMTATTITETSSLALKENFRPIENPLDKVLQLLGQIYDRKDGSSKDEAGLVAEDVYKIIPNLVKTDSNGNPESVFYTRLTVYLLESIKVLSDEITKLKSEK